MKKKQEEEEERREGVVTPLQFFVISHNLRFVSYSLNDALSIVCLYISGWKGYMKTANDELRHVEDEYIESIL
jgi:hypothetical protein